MRTQHTSSNSYMSSNAVLHGVEKRRSCCLTLVTVFFSNYLQEHKVTIPVILLEQMFSTHGHFKLDWEHAETEMQ